MIFLLIITILILLTTAFMAFFAYNMFLSDRLKINKDKILVIVSLLAATLFASLILIFIISRSFFISPFIVRGSSMNPTYSKNDYLIINNFDRKINRNDTIVFKSVTKNLFKI